MNNTKIEWCDMTWNPVVGCLHGCEYCYARRIAERFGGKQKYANIFDLENPVRGEDGKILAYPYSFSPTFHRYRLNDCLGKKGRNIFVCSMADLFGEWVPDEWIKAVFDACKQAPQHTYMFLTKNPERYVKLAENMELPHAYNFWYGSTVTNNTMPIFTSGSHNCFVSAEPLLEELRQDRIEALTNTDWIIIGAMTGPGSRHRQPERKWIEDIAEKAHEAHVPVFMKNSLTPILGPNLIREYPSIMIKKEGK